MVNVREPESATEIRSFLRPVNFCARFIPGLATTAEPLSKAFSWVKEQKRAFEQLK